MPRIDPLQLLTCLGVLLGPHGGIKSPEDVGRLVSLMSKFSKKLVSKCIYVQILQATTPELLAQFMRQGGWDLVSVWIIEATQQGNGPLLEQLLALTIQSPLDINQLQINNCPRAVKGLTREAPNEKVRELAVMVVDTWVQMARQEVKQPQVPVAIPQMQTYPSVMSNMMPTMVQESAQPVSTVNQEYLQQQPEPQQFIQTQPIIPPVMPMPIPETVEHVQVDEKMVLEETVEGGTTQLYQEEIVNEVMSQNVETLPNAVHSVEEPVVPEPEEEETNSGGSTEENEVWDAPLGELPVYKIVFRDGKQVLARVGSAGSSIKTNSGTNEVVINVANEEVNKVQETVQVPIQQEVSAKVLKSKAGRRKQLLKPSSVTDSETPFEESEKERKKVVTQVKTPKAKELENKMAERLKEKTATLKEKLAEREKEKDRKAKLQEEKDRKVKLQEEKDRATLAKLMGTNKVGTVGKIPKKLKSDDDKKSSHNEERKSELRRSSSEDERRKDRNSKSGYRRDKDDSRKSQPKTDSKKDLPKSKSPSISSSNGTTTSSTNSSSSSSPSVSNSGNKSKVKTFHAKPRSTGLEEQPPPPPSRGQIKKDKDRKAPLSLGNKRSPPPVSKDQTPPEKKVKLVVAEDEAIKKATASKSKPKPTHVLLESDFFMDALTAMPRPVPRKRKRRTSSSKDDQSPSGKSGEPESPTQSPRDKKLSPTGSRPNFQFYTDTLETPKGDEQLDESMEAKTTENRTPTPPGDGVEDESKDSSESSTKGLLVTHRSANRVKKSVKFKDGDALCTVVYFELDETERVNVTKTFGDLRILELEAERECLQNAKKMAITEMYEEKMQWRRLIPIDAPPALVEPGKNSEEKNIQLAREKTTLQVIYFDPSMIPDCPAEPESENHPTTDPKVMPLDDTTGNTESVKDFSNVPWPEPKVGPPPAPAYVPHSNPFTPNHMHSSVPAGGGWRTGDGQVLVTGPGEVFPPPNNFMAPNTGYETGNPGAYAYGYENPGGFIDGGNFGGPPLELANGPLPGPNNFMFPGPPNFRQQGPGNWGPNPMGGPPGPMVGPPMGPAPNDMRGGPPRFRSRGGNRGSWQGPPRGGGGLRGGKGWSGSGGGNNNRGVCKHFRSGYCRNEERCNFLHPGVNGPKY